MEKHLVEHVAPHSVQLSTNAKGKVQIEVKVYGADPAHAGQRAVEVLKTTKQAVIAAGFELAAG